MLPARRIFATLLALGTTLAMPAVAHGAITFTKTKWSTCPTVWTTGGGQSDNNGVLYAACGSSIFIDNKGARRTTAVGVSIVDVSPSPDGAFVYATTTGNALIRLKRQADNTTYKRDTSWKPENFTLSTVSYAPSGRNLTTDAAGNIYFSNSLDNAPNAIVKYDAAGKVKTVFGGFTDTKEDGKFSENLGIGVTRDGRSVFVEDKVDARVQRFDIRADGSYGFAKKWGSLDDVNCATGKFAAPSDLNVTAWNEVYVLDTSCQRVQAFDMNGTFLGQITVNTRPHQFAVAGNGVAYLNQGSSIASPNPAHTGAYPAITAIPEGAYTTTSRTMCPNEIWTNGSGQAANDGTLFMACRYSVYVDDANGVELGRIQLPSGYKYYDVAPSPDKKYLYVTRMEEWKGNAKTVYGQPHAIRMVRTGTTGIAYTYDPTWKLGDFNTATKSWHPYGRYIATDFWGDIYFSNGGWVYHWAADGTYSLDEPAVNAILKYSPEGVKKTMFMSSDELGDFNTNLGLAVTRDGRTIYTVEHTAGRVQRFDYDGASGNYKQGIVSQVKAWGTSDPTPEKCDPADGKLALPYDIGVDPWGFVYVADTVCSKVEKFDADGKSVSSTVVAAQIHGLAVDIHGNVFLGYGGQIMKRTAGNPEPGPLPTPQPLGTPTAPPPPPPPPGGTVDTTAPVISTWAIPAITTTQTIAVTSTATDNVGVTHIRLENEDGNWSAWMPYAASVNWTLSPGFGTKAVGIQVKDANGNLSPEPTLTNGYLKYTKYQTIIDTQDPVISSLVVPAIVHFPTPTGATVHVEMTVTDDTGATKMRIADENGEYDAWQPYKASFDVPITPASYGTKAIFVQVQDGAGHWSDEVLRFYSFQP
jgi:sugar lactone lactonase YvrE